MKPVEAQKANIRMMMIDCTQISLLLLLFHHFQVEFEWRVKCYYLLHLFVEFSVNRH